MVNMPSEIRGRIFLEVNQAKQFLVDYLSVKNKNQIVSLCRGHHALTSVIDVSILGLTLV